MSGHSIEQVIDRLRELDCAPKRQGPGWAALCPVHGDKNPSLSVNVGSGQPWVVKCHAGCSQADVLAAIGLRAGQSQQDGATVYSYRDRYGALVFQVTRLPGKAGFPARRPDGNGGWIDNLDGIEKPLYRLPELIEGIRAGALVFFCEGEKDTHNVSAAGLAATTLFGGTDGTWFDHYTETLRGARLVILPDNDAPGRALAHRIAREVYGRGVEFVKVVELDGLPEHGDVTDWLANGGTADQLVTLAGRAPFWTPPPRFTQLYIEALAEMIDRLFKKPTRFPAERIFLYLLDRAPKGKDWTDYRTGERIRRNQVITTQAELARISGANRDTVKRILRRLETAGEITSRVLHGSYSLLSIMNLERYTYSNNTKANSFPNV